MLSDTAVSCEISGAVATLRFERPERRNAFDGVMLETLGRHLERLADDPDCHVVVLRGAGGHFCAGWDFAELDRLRSSGDRALRGQFDASLSLLRALEAHPKVIVSLAEGTVMGFGFALIARSDIVLANRSCGFALPEIGLGIVPAIVMVDAQRMLPARLALDCLLSGRRLDADEASSAGLVSRVLADTEFDAAAGAVIAGIASASGSVLAKTKALFRRLSSLERDAADTAAIAAAIEALGAPAASEGIAAQREKRRPRWPE